MKANQIRRGLSHRLSAMILAVCMVFTMSPPITAAEASDKDSGEPVMLSGFAELPENIREQSVPLGVSLDELTLPDTLEAMVYTVSEDTQPPTVPKEPLEPEEPPVLPSEPMDSGDTTPPVEDAPTIGTSDEDTAPPTETENNDAATPPASDGTANEAMPPEESSQPEESTPPATEQQPAADTPDEDAAQDEQADAEPPAQSDEPASKAETIEENDVPLAASPSDAENNKPEPTPPSNDITTSAAITISGVTWESNPIYDNETEGTYLFTAVLPSGYTVEDGVAMPEITVVVEQAEQSTVDKVIAMIDALPAMDEWTAMEETAARAVMNDILTAKAAYDALTDEEKALIDEVRTAKLIELAGLAEQMALMMPMVAADFGTNCTWEIVGDVLTIAPKNGTSGTLPSFASFTSQPWHSQKADIKSVKVENGVKANTSSRNLFYGLSACTTMDLSGLDTTDVTSMQNMFNGCKGLTALDLSKFNTAAVTTMEGMFYGCSGLTTLDVSKFNTAQVTNMGSMFYKCSGLTDLGLSEFDTTKVTDMGNMFYNCSGLTSLDLSSFNTAEVTDMR